MKRKILTIFLSAALVCAAISGCGSELEEEEWFSEEEEDEDSAPEEDEQETEREDAEENEQGMKTVYLLAREICAEVTNEECQVWYEREYEYDDHGNVVKISRYRADGETWWSEEQELSVPEEEMTVQEEPAAEEEIAVPEEESAAEEEIAVPEEPTTAEHDIDSITANETTLEFKYEYDADGRVEKRTKYSMWADSAGSIDSYLSEEYACEYHRTGSLLKEKRTLFFDAYPEPGQLPYDGKIHYTEEKEYDADGKEIRFLQTGSQDDEYGLDGTTEYTYEYEYDGEGRMIEKIYQDQRRNEDGSMRDPYVESFDYDEYGNLVRIVARYISEDGTESETGGHAIDYEYDSNGYLISESTYYGDTGNRIVNENTYDVNGNIVRLVSDGVIVENSYDAKGNIVKVVENLGQEEQTVWINEYDENDNIVRQEYISSYGFSTIDEYQYDADGRIIRATRTSQDGYWETHEYKYDANGNLIEDALKGATYDDAVITRYQYTEIRIPDGKDSYPKTGMEQEEVWMPAVSSAREPEDLSECWKNCYVNEETLEIIEKGVYSVS